MGYFKETLLEQMSDVKHTQLLNSKHEDKLYAIMLLEEKYSKNDLTYSELVCLAQVFDVDKSRAIDLVDSIWK